MSDKHENPEPAFTRDVFEMDYWTKSKDIFTYLDIVSPSTGSKFKCSVCGGSHWGTSTIQVEGKNHPMSLAPVEIKTVGPGHKPIEIQEKRSLVYYYTLMCLTCANTLFFSAAMVQLRLDEFRKLEQGT